MEAPRWITELYDVKASGQVGAVLSFNTSDRVYIPGETETPRSLQFYLASKYRRLGYHVGRFTVSEGVIEMTPPGEEKQSRSPFSELKGFRASDEVLVALSRILRNPEPDQRCVVILDYAEHLAPATSGNMGGILTQEQLATLEILHSWGQSDDIRSTQNLVIMITYEGEINSLISNSGGYRSIQIDLPDEGIRKAFSEFLFRIRDERELNHILGVLDNDLSLDEFSRINGGLRLLDIDGLLRRSAARKVPIGRNDIRESKKRTIDAMCRGLVDVIEPEEGFEAVAGLEGIKDYFNYLKSVWGAGLRNIPQAILLSGVPGCGKSNIIKAIASEFGCPCLVMRNVRESWVGSSERNLERVLQVAESLSPCLLWTDEIDQMFGGERSAASGDSGTSERIRGRIFEFFGSMKLRGDILWMATTNRPDLLDSALLDRFQVILPFLHPTQADRVELIPILAKQVGRKLAADVDCVEIASMTEMDQLSVRAMVEIVAQAATFADMDDGKESTISRRHIIEAVKDFMPRSNPLQNRFIALKAVEMTSKRHLLPWMTRNGLRQGIRWPKYLDGVVDPETGAIDMIELDRRCNELQRMLYSERLMK